jgi:hypothetical protein
LNLLLENFRSDSDSIWWHFCPEVEAYWQQCSKMCDSDWIRISNIIYRSCFLFEQKNNRRHKNQMITGLNRRSWCYLDRGR